MVSTFKWILAAGALAFWACGDRPAGGEPLPSTGLLPVDSFWLQQLAGSGNELHSFQRLDAQTLISFDDFNTVHFYTLHGDTFRYSGSKHLRPARETPAFLSLDTALRRLLVLDERRLYSYDLQGQPADTLDIDTRLLHLGQGYFAGSANFLPLLRFGDTLVSYYSHTNPDDFLLSYREPAFLEFSLSRKGPPPRSYLAKPQALKARDVNFLSFHLAHQGRLYKLYDGLDTLYGYDRAKDSAFSIPLGNRDYLLPAVADDARIYDPQYRVKRALSSFSYCGLFHHAGTGHFVLFYHTPAVDSSAQLPSGPDLPLKAAVLDGQFRIIRYLVLQQRFFSPMCFFPYGRNGLAMPLYNDDPTHRPVKVLVFSF